MTDTKLAQAASFVNTYNGQTNWSPDDVDKLETIDLSQYKKIVNDCRFYYQRDPIASTVLNKLSEVGVTKLVFEKGSLSENEFRVFLGVQNKIQEFIESCSLEYLITGLVVPEIKYAPVSKLELQKLGVKKYDTLNLPISMWLRDPTTIKINSFMTDKPSYFIVLPDNLIYFIMNKGTYDDGNKDLVLWDYLNTYYQEFILQVNTGLKEIPYYNDNIVRRKVITGTQYPIPYLYPALESLKHKRNLRRMDYSIASRVISAIMLVQLGSDEFPITEDEEYQFDNIREQMMWRNSGNRDVEKIFQLFANHTLKITWVFPDTSALLDEKKYADVNSDIFLALGFPKILTTGETERSQSSDPEIAINAPTKTMETMQDDLIGIAEDLVYNITELNGFKQSPKVRFEKINLQKVSTLVTTLSTLYESGNISRESFDKAFGYTFSEEVVKRADENKLLKELGVEEFSPKPFSPKPGVPGQQQNQQQNQPKNSDEETEKTNK